MKIAAVTCYRDPDFIRNQAIRAALKTLPDVQGFVVKNTRTGLLRYPQVIGHLIGLKVRERPDVYILTYRGHEILPLVLLIAGKKPVWFDEYVVPTIYATDENRPRSLRRALHAFFARRGEAWYKRWLKRCSVVFADTHENAELSARTSDMNLRKYTVLPVRGGDTFSNDMATVVARKLQPLITDTQAK